MISSIERHLALGIAAAMLGSAADAAAPLAAYGRPSIEQAALSPNGTLIAVAQTDGEKRTVTIVRAGSDQLVVRLQAGESKIRGLVWGGDGHLLITASRTAVLSDVIAPRAEWSVTLDYNLKTGATRGLLDDAKGALEADYSEPQIRILHGKAYAFVEAATFVGEEGRELAVPGRPRLRRHQAGGRWLAEHRRLGRRRRRTGAGRERVRSADEPLGAEHQGRRDVAACRVDRDPIRL